MEKILAIIYLTVVFLLCAVCLVYRIFEKIEKFRKFCASRRKKPTPEIPKSEASPQPASDVVGKTFSVFLEPLSPKPDPVIGESREPSIVPETEPEISPEDVDIRLNRSVDPGEEIVIDLGEEAADGLSKGMTYEEIKHAIDVAFGNKSGEDDRFKAGETFSLMPSDFIEMICMHENNRSVVENLITDYLDFPNKKERKPNPVAEFDLDNYV